MALGLDSGNGHNNFQIMLIPLTTGLRFRLAIILAAVASLCFVAPQAVLAFGHGEAMIDCLTHADMADHAGINVHEMKPHGDHSCPSGHQPGCCGLFCMSAIANEGVQIATPVVTGDLHCLAIETILFRRAPNRPDRPPISFLIV